jgi:O-antigen ligase
MRTTGTACSVLCSVGLVMSGSRASLVGLAASAATFLALRYGRKPLAIVVIGAAVVLGFVAFPINVEFTPNSAMSRLISPDRGVAASNQFRAQRMDEALAEISSRPLVGSGFSEARQAHNIVLQLLATAGLFGLLALIAGGIYVARSVRTAWRSRRRSGQAVADALAAAIIGVVATMMFSTNLWDRYLLLFLWLGGVWIVHLSSDTATTTPRTPSRTGGYDAK